MPLSIRLVPVGDTTLVIALTGELDTTTRPILAAFLDPLAQSAVTCVVVAAADLGFCDLNGFRQLASAHQAMLARGGHLSIAEAQPPLRRLIALAAEHGLPDIPVYASMAEAMSATDVESYQIDTPLTPASALVSPPVLRHPPLRTLHNVPHTPRVRRSGSHLRSQPRPQRVDPPLNDIIRRSGALREQAAHHHQAVLRQLDKAQQTRILLHDALSRCGESLVIMRASLAEAHSIVSMVPWAPPRPIPSAD
ncbi:anti-anti-sigma factor [Nonomuraea polychroma]|uniref:Anti-anti-sigma factor n=1 Tax=Nonomuraea polychroma TaxID=46176 RepID=A0A438MJR1_9ACTN|nr:STAS domain-containing protein [Nonomuraea polychroma]RVX45776.1 anti-anti-sigma factor [Nonomuraea polychroma]